MDTMGKRIKTLRKAMDLTQQELGERLGVSKGNVSQWESDATEPKPDKLIVLSRIFGVSVEYLKTGIDTPMYSGDDETMLFQAFRMMPPDVRRAFLLIGQRLAS